MIIVRYADDLIAGFEHEDDARRFLDALRERFGAFSPALHPGKTRWIEFGRHAATERKKGGIARPHTFALSCASPSSAENRDERDRRDHVQAKLQESKTELRRIMHQPVPSQGQWLRQVVTSHFAYYAVPTNSGRSLPSGITSHLWRRTVRRRSRESGFTWDRLEPEGPLLAQVVHLA